jgi:hypothetical protein
VNVAAPLVGVHPSFFRLPKQPAEHKNGGTEQCRLFAGADKRGPMRTLIDPPPSLRCDLCNGELRLKKIEQHTSSLESDTTTFVCAKCGHEKSYRVSRDPHSAPRAEAAQAPTTTAPKLEQTGGAGRKKAGAAKP